MPDKFYNDCAEEDDFLTAGVYYGEYRVLSAALSARSRNEDQLLPGLRRQDEAMGVKAALCMAAVDVAKFNPMLTDSDKFKEALLKVSEEQYAVAASAVLVNAIAPVLVRLFASIPENARANSSGPIWVDNIGFARYLARSGVVDETWKIGLDSHGVLFVQLHVPKIDV